MSTYELKKQSHEEVKYFHEKAGKSINMDSYKSKLESFTGNCNPNQEKKLGLAVAYLEEHYHENGVVDQEKVTQHLSNIDFSKDVKLRVVKPGDQIYRHEYDQKVTNREYFTLKGRSPGSLGINQDYKLGKIKSPESRQFKEFTTRQPVVALETTHNSGTIDTWSIKRPGKSAPKHHEFNTSDHSKNRIVVDNKDKTGPTRTKSKHTRSIYKMEKTVVDGKTQKKLDHRSGPYVRGGSKQLLIPNRNRSKDTVQHKSLVQIERKRKHQIKR